MKVDTYSPNTGEKLSTFALSPIVVENHRVLISVMETKPRVRTGQVHQTQMNHISVLKKTPIIPFLQKSGTICFNFRIDSQRFWSTLLSAPTRISSLRSGVLPEPMGWHARVCLLARKTNKNCDQSENFDKLGELPDHYNQTSRTTPCKLDKQ